MHTAAEHWSDAGFTEKLARVSWMASPAVQLHLNERATGHPVANWITGWTAGYCVRRDLNVLVLGCGEGWLERYIISLLPIRHIDACDFAADAVERAREAARDIPRISYSVVDLNHDRLATDAYDLVIAHSVLHHVENLEHAFAQIQAAMKRDAVLIVNEYVGPKRFQFSDEVLDIINQLLGCLPERLRRGLIEPRLYGRKERPTEEQMIANDPSEAVRSDELLPFIRRHFDVLDERPVGGTILQHLLYDIVQNFDIDQPRERSMLEILCIFEAALIDAGAIPCDFVNVAARRRDCGTPRTAYRMPAHPSDLGPESYDADPVGFGPGRAVRRTAGSSAALPLWMIRILRAALLSRLQVRRSLFRRSRIREWIERLRCRISFASPDAWILSRFRAVADPASEDDKAIVGLLATVAKIAQRNLGLPPL